MKAMKLAMVLALVCQFSLIGIGNARSNEREITCSVLNRAIAAAENTNTRCLPFGSHVINSVQADTEVYKHQEAGLQFEAPSKWSVKPDGSVLTLTADDGSLAMVFWVPEDDDFQAAVKALDTELGKTIKSIKKDGKPKEGELNGMQTFIDGGTGQVDGTTIQWSAVLVKAKRPLIILSFAAPGVWEKHSDIYQGVLKSIKKVS